MTSVAPAKNGAFMHIPTNTPRVYGLTTPTHARMRAGHPLAGGRLGKQNAVRAILGRLVSSSRKNMSILEDTVRQAYSFDSFQTMCMLAAAIFTRNDSRVSKSRTRQYAERALFAQRLKTGPVTLRQSGSVLDRVIEHADVSTLREATRQSGASVFAAFDGSD